jgi:hypothetical protein
VCLKLCIETEVGDNIRLVFGLIEHGPKVT